MARFRPVSDVLFEGTRVVPRELAERWIAARGSSAERWLHELPQVIRRCASRWDLQIEHGLHGGSVSVVVAATAGDRPAVLKLGAPWSQWSEAEAAALQAWDGRAAPAVLGSACSGRELLLERVEPGKSPTKLSTSQVAQLIITLAHPPRPWSTAVPDMAEALSQRFRRAEENRHDLMSERLLARSRKAAVAMASEIRTTPALVHGDLLTKNILVCKRRGLLAIDPNPAVGDPSYDAALWAVTEEPVSDARQRCMSLAAELALNPDRVWDWALVLGAVEVCLAPRPRAEATLALLAEERPPWWQV